jgi:hypothetical protein
VTGVVAVSDDGRRLSAGVDAAPGLATSVVRALDDAGVLVDTIEVRQPSLDDVFFTLTGGHIEAGDASGADAEGAEGSEGGGESKAGSGAGAAPGVAGGRGGDGRSELEGARA